MKATFTAILVTVFIYGAVAFPTMDSQFIEHDSIVPEVRKGS